MYEPRHIPASHRLSAWLLSALFALSLCLQQAWAAPAERTVIPLGQAVGIKLFADGVLVVALADGPTPARACGLRQGDIITAMDGAAVGSTEQVQDLLADTAGAPIVLSVRRGADALALTACARENNGVWQLGAWIRDSMAGIGTLTYYDPATGQYGALGHGITDVDTAQLMPLASGAIMDLSVDITSAVYEVVEKRPDLSWWEAARSGMNVGRAAMGTMTTTLLFAYSGGYIALLMVFMAQGTPVDHILNYKYVAAEIIHTVIGSFGLVTVAPFTALCAGLFLARRGGHPQPQEEADG